METTQTSTIASKDSRSAWRKTDTMWMLGLYGTAIGAGVLFLPINAGVGGMIPLIIMAILAFPMTFFAHRGLTRFVLSGKNPGEDITEVVEEHFGIGAGKLITLLYFFAIYPTAKEEMIGEWLNENTITGIASHRVIHRPFPVADAVSRDSVSSAAPFHCGIRYRASSISTPTNGNTRILIALTIICSPKRTMVIIPTIRISDRIARGGGVIPSYDPVAGNSGNGVLVQPLSDHLFFRRCEA